MAHYSLTVVLFAALCALGIARAPLWPDAKWTLSAVLVVVTAVALMRIWTG